MQKGSTALHLASAKGYVLIVRLLLQKQADVNICREVWTLTLQWYVFESVVIVVNTDIHKHLMTLPTV